MLLSAVLLVSSKYFLWLMLSLCFPFFRLVGQLFWNPVCGGLPGVPQGHAHRQHQAEPSGKRHAHRKRWAEPSVKLKT